MLRSNNSVATLTMGSWLSVKCKGPWGGKCVYVWNTLSQMGESARYEAQWLPSGLWELHSCESCERSKPWLEGKQAPNWAPKTPLERSWSIDA